MNKLVLELPVVIGEKVWDIHFPESPFTVIGYRIGRMIWEDIDGSEQYYKESSETELCMHYEAEGIASCASVSSIGKTIFLTEDEALKASLKAKL